METNLIINGKSVKGNRRIEVRNPASPNKIVGICNAADVLQANQAIECAWKAYQTWRMIDIRQRAKILEKAAEKIKNVYTEWPCLLTQEQGKIIAESTGECQFIPVILNTSPILASKLITQEKKKHDQNGWWMVKKNPTGVVSVISPWNYPLTLTWFPIQQALLAGNTIVVKPSSYTPLTISRSIEAVFDLFPPGVINLVPGSGSEVGKVLITHPLVRKVSFTGSIQTGIDVMAKASYTLKNIGLELGGNDAAIILKDADLSKNTLEKIFWGVFLNAGQVCMSIKRIYVHESRFKEFVELFTDMASKIVVGDGLDSRSNMGPINNMEQMEKMKSLLEDARKRGSKIVQVGKKLDEKQFNKGYFHLPTIITGLDRNYDDYEIVKEEQFGPVIPIMSFQNDEEAIRLANNSLFGLGSSVWSKNEKRSLHIAEQLEAGYTMINQHSVNVLELFAPFGGQKQSGIGRSQGLEGLLSYTESHTIISKWM